jgi:large subunit ribosomal protein L24
MNGTKMRNRQIYYATHQTANSQLSATLSKELRKKYGKRSVRILEGDAVKVIRGEFSGIDGKVTKVSLSHNGINIEGVKKDRVKGDKFDVFIHTSNIVITGINSDDKWRINKLEGKKATATRVEDKPKTETVQKKLKEEKKDTKKVTKQTVEKSLTNKTKKKYGYND